MSACALSKAPQHKSDQYEVSSRRLRRQKAGIPHTAKTIAPKANQPHGANPCRAHVMLASSHALMRMATELSLVQMARRPTRMQHLAFVSRLPCRLPWQRCCNRARTRLGRKHTRETSDARSASAKLRTCSTLNTMP